MVIDESPFMLVVFKCKTEKIKSIPAVLHVDGTARIQTVDKNFDEFYYDLIRQFYQLTGIPMVLNTSFNIDGEPIVETPNDAIKTFKSGRLDYLILGDYLIPKEIYSDDIWKMKTPVIAQNIKINYETSRAQIIKNFGAMFDPPNKIVDLTKEETELLSLINGNRKVIEIIQENRYNHSACIDHNNEVDTIRRLFMKDVIGLN
jgi:hypothetical protein